MFYTDRPQYGSSNITVFVWGKNTILKFLGNTIAPTKSRDNLFQFTLYTIVIYKVEDARCHLHRHAFIQHTFFHEIRTPTENKHARIVVIGWQQIWKPMKLSQVEKRIRQTLTNSKDVIQKGQEYSCRISRARSTRGQENEAWALYQKIHPGVLGWPF